MAPDELTALSQLRMAPDELTALYLDRMVLSNLMPAMV
jgi:hypothetical protein